jgi:transposase
MGRARRTFGADLKARVALEAAKGDRTLAELGSQYQVHPSQITQWKRQLLAALPEVFARRRDRRSEEQEILVAELYRQIGQLKVELDWVKKKSGLGG